MTRIFSSLLAVALVVCAYSQRGHAQFKRPSAGDSIQDAIKVSVSDHNAQPAAAEQSDDTSTEVLDDLGGFDIAPYQSRVLLIIGTNWRHLINTSGTNLRHRDGTTVVKFKISREGEIRDIRLVQSSDQEDLDAIAVQCISLSAPLPALPKGLEKKELNQKFTFKFRGAKKSPRTRN
jgi:TonB family protein